MGCDKLARLAGRKALTDGVTAVTRSNAFYEEEEGMFILKMMLSTCKRIDLLA